MLDPEYGRRCEAITGEGCGMDRELPAEHPGHVVRPGVVVRQWPSRYLSPTVTQGLRLFELHRKGLRLTNAPALLWPYPLMQAMERCAAEVAIKEAGRG